MRMLLLLLALSINTDPGKISKINKAKLEAKKAYLSGDYKTAIEKYQYLTDSLGVNDDDVKLNLANAYFSSSDSTQALQYYQSLTQSSDKSIRSRAEQQLGVIANRQGKHEEALNHFKQAIKANPANNDARYNYELLKKKLEDKKKEEEQQKQQKNDQQQDQKQEQDQQKQDQQDQQKKEQENKDQQEQENKDSQDKQDQEKKDDKQKENEKQEQNKEEQNEKSEEQKEKKDLPPSVKEKLQQMEISEEKAKMILEAMRNAEIQYLQQQKRKPTQKREKGKPDW